MIYFISKKLEISAAHSLGRWLVDLFPECYKATVQESFGNTAVVVDEEKIRGIEHLVP